jgi:hypothetical protein
MKGDLELRECVALAAAQADAPMAMVSFVMKSIQLFHTAVGLPAELQLTRAISRSDSFCQFVVKTEEAFIVTDARRDLRLPQAMVVTYGMTAYAGVPIRVRGQVLGALCVADGSPRCWSSALTRDLDTLATRVSERLETMIALHASVDEDSTLVPPCRLAARATVLAEIVRRSLAEVGPMVRLANGAAADISPEGMRRAGSALAAASGFYDEMMVAVLDLCIATKRVEESVVANAHVSS